MDSRNLEDKMREILMKETEVSSKTREEIWQNIDRELFCGDKGKGIISMTKKGRLVRLAAAAAAAAILIIGLQTEPGLALVDRIKEMFIPEKNITQEIEGEKEHQNVQLNEGKDAKYVIYIDEERYKLVKGSESDRIEPKIPLGGRYPEVSMEIKRITDKKPEDLIEEVEALLKEEFADVSKPKRVEHPVSGWMVRGLAGSQWDSRLVKVYITDNHGQDSFVITQRYFLEAEEGHGARFDQMLEEFYIVDGEDM